VTGAPGVGKSRLVAEAVEGLTVGLADARPGTWWGAVSQALGVEIDPSDPVRPVVAALAARGPTVLVLDDADPVVESLAPVIEGWLAGDDALRVVVTSRERLRLADEVVVALEPLPVDDGVRLLVDRSAGGRAAWSTELAAARAEVLAPADLLAALDQRFKVLKGLYGAIEWSWDHLSDPERSALAQMAVFEGGFSPASAEEVLELPGGAWWLDVLQQLVGRSLVRAVDREDPDPVRFELPESVRAFALDKARSLDLLRGASARHRRHYAALGDSFGDRLRRGEPRAIGRLELEARNLSAAWTSALDADPVQAARLCLALDLVYSTRGPNDERRRILDRTLAADPPPTWRAKLLLARARVALLSSELAEAEALGAEAEAIGESSGDPEVQRWVLLALAELHAERGAPIDAREAALACARRSRDAGDAFTEARALRLLGMLFPESVGLDLMEQAVHRLDELDRRTRW
jgi:predicted ATPase